VVPRQQDAHQLLAVVQVAVELELQPQILTLTLQMVLVLLETTALVETDIRATLLEQIFTTQVVVEAAVM
jgi:hypothetical protein